LTEILDQALLKDTVQKKDRGSMHSEVAEHSVESVPESEFLNTTDRGQLERSDLEGVGVDVN
jgi:hypothetical protein